MFRVGDLVQLLDIREDKPVHGIIIHKVDSEYKLGKRFYVYSTIKPWSNWYYFHHLKKINGG